MITADFTLQEEEYLKAGTVPWRQRRVPWFELLPAQGLLFFAAGSWCFHSLRAVGIFIALAGLWILWASVRPPRSYFRLMKRGCEHWEFDQDGVSISTATRNDRHSWSNFGGWRESDLSLVIRSAANPNWILILPKRAIPQEQLDELRSLLREKIGPEP